MTFPTSRTMHAISSFCVTRGVERSFLWDIIYELFPTLLKGQTLTPFFKNNISCNFIYKCLYQSEDMPLCLKLVQNHSRIFISSYNVTGVIQF